MVNRPNPRLDNRLARYQQEVVRWNRQINLVSRQDTSLRVAELIGQCRDTWAELEARYLKEIVAESPFWYFDLGSGGGLPGYVWHLHLNERSRNVVTRLVEPREKRAWFLERLNQLTPDRPLEVWNGRWGEFAIETSPGEGEVRPAQVLISLKALRLTDPEVLEGLSIAAKEGALIDGAEVLIARFFPPDQRMTPALVRELGISDKPLTSGHYIYSPLRRGVVAPKGRRALTAALVVSSYTAAV